MPVVVVVAVAPAVIMDLAELAVAEMQIIMAIPEYQAQLIPVAEVAVLKLPLAETAAKGSLYSRFSQANTPVQPQVHQR
jgi:hypothetical protein